MGKGVFHYCIEGERVGVDGGKIVDVDSCHTPCPGRTPAPQGERGRDPNDHPQVGTCTQLLSQSASASTASRTQSTIHSSLRSPSPLCRSKTRATRRASTGSSVLRGASPHLEHVPTARLDADPHARAQMWTRLQVSGYSRTANH